MRLFHRRRYPVDHYVLVDDAHDVAPETLIAEARRRAGRLAERSTGDARNFTLIHNGEGVARRSDPHVHIFCTRSRRMKGAMLLVVAIRNLLPRWMLG